MTLITTIHPMKINTISLLLLLLGITTACEKELEPYNSPECRLNFVFYNYSGTVMKSNQVNDAVRHSTYSFISASAKKHTEVTRDTLWFEVSTMGFLSDKDRPIRLEQANTGSDAAVPGIHYVPFDDPRFQKICFVPANANKTMVPVIVLRDASLDAGDVNLTFRLAPNEYFQAGYPAMAERTLQIVGRLIQPDNWPYQFGKYSPDKHRLMIEWTGEPWDEDYIRTLLKGDVGYLTYLRTFFRKKLSEENAKRKEAGLEPYNFTF